MFSVVVAADKRRGIGRDGALPWKLKGDMRWFRELTTCPDVTQLWPRYCLDQGYQDKRVYTWEELTARIKPAPELPAPYPGARNAVLMGRKTWDSLPTRFRPLPDRLNGILSRALPPGVFQGSQHVWPSFPEALTELSRDPTLRNVFVVGGGEIFAEALRHPECGRVYFTDIEAEFTCDTVLAEWGEAFREIAVSPRLEEAGTTYRFRVLEKAGSQTS